MGKVQGSEATGTPRLFSDTEEFKILQEASLFYLIECLPDEWESLEEGERDEYLVENANVYVESADAGSIFALIDNRASSLAYFIKQNFLSK